MISSKDYEFVVDMFKSYLDTNPSEKTLLCLYNNDIFVGSEEIETKYLHNKRWDYISHAIQRISFSANLYSGKNMSIKLASIV